MSYFRASTGNPLGWRGNVATLGNEIRHSGPDWKTVAAQHDAAVRAGQQMRQRRQRDAQYRMARVDAAARGDRTRVRIPRLSGLGGLDLASQMERGAQYVFHFTGPNTLVSALSTALRNQIAADTNFGNPVVSAEATGMRVSFTYQGQGSTVGNAGAEMQSVLKSQTAFSNGFLFSGAEGGPVITTTPAAGKTIFTTSPDGSIIQYSDGTVFDMTSGITYDASGNPISASPSANAGAGNQPNNNDKSTFNWSDFLAGFGLSTGIGTALAVGLGIVLLKD